MRGGCDAEVDREREAVRKMGRAELMHRGDGASTGGALVLKQLCKVWPPPATGGAAVVAVDEFSLRVSAGECFGLVGANGAGKSTVLNMVIRTVEPTVGDAYVDGASVLEDFGAASRSLGVVFQSNTLWADLTCADHLELAARMRGIKIIQESGEEEEDPAAGARIYGKITKMTLQELGLTPGRVARALSGGMKRKLCFALALVGDPAVCLLDEPTTGLDPVSRRNVWATLRRHADRRAVVLTSHLMEEVEALCHRSAIMVTGRIRRLGTIADLKRGQDYDITVVARAEPARVDALVDRLFHGQARRALLDDEDDHHRPPAENKDEDPEEGGRRRLSRATRAEYQVPRDAVAVGRCFAAMEAARDDVGLTQYSISQPRLETVFVRIVQDYEDDGAAPQNSPLVSEDDEDDNDGDGDWATALAARRRTTTGGCHCARCSTTTRRRGALAATAVFIAAALVALFVLRELAAVAVVALVLAIWACAGCKCACTAPPPAVDEPTDGDDDTNMMDHAA